MTIVKPIGASSTDLWDSFNWNTVSKSVYKLQMRIAKATREGRFAKAKALQWLLTNSFYAKLLAIKRVTSNKGAKTPGVDKVIWNSSKQKISAVKTLKRRGYKPQPLRRIYIAKSNGKRRPLGIPTIKDRAMQALHLLALEPIAETLADPNSYGFRPHRSTADAIDQCFKALCRKNSAKWILEADIKSCFDQIDHKWLLDNVNMDKNILEKWLSSGFMENGKFYDTKEGTPQGGIISPRLATIALNGLEKAVTKGFRKSDKVNIVIYADDFIITGASKELLENYIKPRVAKFLKERGLELSEDKTRITNIEQGFDFLGFNIKKYNEVLLIKPSRKSIREFLRNIRKLIKSNPTATTEGLIHLMNSRIRGWANYFKHVVAKKTFSKIDHQIFLALRSWIRRRHLHKPWKWRKRKYFRQSQGKSWIFFAKTKNNKYVDLFKAYSIPIKRHVKIKSQANPFDPQFNEYFKIRALRKIKDKQDMSIKDNQVARVIAI